MCFQKKIGVFILFSFFFLQNCGEKKASIYSKHEKGFYYHLISFTSDLKKNNTHFIALLDINYATQNDSVFWNSKSDFDDKYYINIDPEVTKNDIETYLKTANEGDSACLLIPAAKFFEQQFFTKKMPAFVLHDSIIKVNIKIKTLFSTIHIDSLIASWALKESGLIQNYLSKNKITHYYKDSLNVYWLDGKPDVSKLKSFKNKTVTLNYKGYLLSGKQFDESPENWQVNTTTPDQMLKGLNYVIKFLNTGENAKIILPSYLAFGELGTGNIIPPYTPLLYQININSIEN